MQGHAATGTFTVLPAKPGTRLGSLPLSASIQLSICIDCCERTLVVERVPSITTTHFNAPFYRVQSWHRRSDTTSFDQKNRFFWCVQILQVHSSRVLTVENSGTGANWNFTSIISRSFNTPIIASNSSMMQWLSFWRKFMMEWLKLVVSRKLTRWLSLQANI